MPREKITFRDNLARIIKKYPDKDFLTVNEVTDYVGLDQRTVKELFYFQSGQISTKDLAKYLSLERDQVRKYMTYSDY